MNKERLMTLLKGRGALAVGIWTLMNLVIVSWHFAFSSRTELQQLAIGWGMVAILAATTLTVLAVPRIGTRPVGTPPGAAQVRNGTPAAAFAGACLAGGLAWVFGVWLALFAIPPVAYCLARFRAERAVRREEEAEP